MFGIIPLIYAIYLSLLKWDGLSNPIFVGGAQWVRLFTTPDVWQALGNTVLIFAFGQIPVILGALVGASLLSQPRLRFRSFYQTAFFLPQVTSLVAVAIVFQSIFSDKYGLMNDVLKAIGLPQQGWLSNSWEIKAVIALMIIWRGFGYFLIIFMAGMSSIDQSLFEAARVDGAGPRRIFTAITIPLLIPTIVFVALTGTIAGLQIFTEPQVLFSGSTSAGGPNNAGMTMMLLQYQYLGGVGSADISVQPDLGFASVIGWVIFILLVVIAVANNRLLRNSWREN
ncbi:MAG TPA: sugar ABC transporter permease [Galbitalea sp.]|nr:sugar ABC transporter permease [Galbitalea sp.]